MRNLNIYLLQKMYQLGLINPENDYLACNQNERLDLTLYQRGELSEHDLCVLYHELMELPIWDDSVYLEELWKGVSFQEMKKYGSLIYETSSGLILIMYDPLTYLQNDYLISQTNQQLKKFIVKQSYYTELLQKADVQNQREYLYDLNNSQPTIVNKLAEDVSNFAEYDVLNAPIVRTVNNWLEEAIVSNGSDLHFEPGKEKGRVRIRLDGKLHYLGDIPNEGFLEVITRLKLMSGVDITKKFLPQDGKIIYNYQQQNYDLRVSTIPTVLGEKLVVRILDSDKLTYDRSNLNYTKEESEIIDNLISKPSGVVLITGPTGCGKTTTLYTFLSELVSEENNIISVEDPVEYSLKGISQVQINEASGLTFAKCLRSILRQDPNILMIGEIRDEETAQIAMRAAITGHLVFSTLHTNEAIGAIGRLVDMGVPKYLIVSALQGVISQRLVRRLCPKCKISVKVNKTMANTFSLPLGKTIYKPGGCPFCHNTGYDGRMNVSEILILDKDLRSMIENNDNWQEMLEDLAVEKGMIKLSKRCLEKVLAGETSLEEVIKYLS